MEISESTQKKNATLKRASVSDGKRKLSAAIRSENVEGMRDALLFLSTTSQSLAWQVKEERGEDSSLSERTRKLIHLRINVNFDVQVPNHHNHCPDSDQSSIDSAPPSFWTTKALHAAIGPNPVHTEMVRCLLAPHTLSSDSVSETDSETILTTNAREKLLQTSHDFHSEGSRRPGTTPLAMACHYRNLDLIKILLEHGANPNTSATKRPGSTPLALACQQGDIAVSRLLLEHGADPNVCGNDGLTPLIRASRVGNLEIIKLLLTPPTTTTITINDSEKNGHQRSTSSFHKNQWGTNLYHYDQQSMNALMHACAENHESVVRFLVHGGKNSLCAIGHYVNHYRVDPALWYASAHGSASIVKFLMDECRATASYRKDPTVYSSTPLEEASQWGHAATVKVLLERSGSDSRTRAGQKARTQAERSGHAKVVELLDVWRDRMDKIEASTFPLGLLPRLLSRKAESAHRILCNHADGLICYHHGRRSNNNINNDK